MKENISAAIFKSIWSYFLLISFLLAINTTVSSAEIKDGPVARDKVTADVQTLLHQEKYDALEKMANRFRKDKARFTDGSWKLSAFYDAFRPAKYGWNELFGNIDGWLKKCPDSITARVAAGESWHNFAWEARGGGYGKTVTDEGWKLMRERTVKAYDFVKKRPDDPSKDCMHRYNLLLRIAVSQGWERERYEALFRQAVSFEPSYYDYYFRKAIYLLPRWHGEEGEWQRFADEAVKLTPASEGMGIYTRILWTLWGHGVFKTFREPDISWQKTKQGFIDIERSYPNSPYTLNFFCRFACVAGDKKTARALFQRIGNIPYTEVWEGRANFEKWRRWANAGE